MTALEQIAWLFLLIAILCALIVVLDLCLRPPQRLWIMNVVWPATALWAGPFGLILYCFLGRAAERPLAGAPPNDPAATPSSVPGPPEPPSWSPMALNALACGAGCAPGYVLAEAIIPFIPPVSGSLLLARWTVEASCAVVMGIVVQYFAVRSMPNDGFWQTLISAVKEGAMPLIAWQIGMISGMAVAHFLIFQYPLAPSDPVFWWMMQVSMGLGFGTAYPINLLLLRTAAETRTPETPIFAPLHPST